MPEIYFNGKRYQSHSGESVLDCLLRHELAVPCSCRSGICQTCLMRVVKGTPPETAQKGLKAGQVHQGYFLPCACVPLEAMEIALPDTAVSHFKTVVFDIHHFTPDTVRLRLSRPKDFAYRAGQFLTLFHPDGHGRSYSLASLPELEGELEFHVRRHPGGQISGWIANDLRPGDVLTLSGAVGNCIYMPGLPEQPLLLIATGTGLAPLYGILREALHHGHHGIIKLYHGSRTQAGLYLHKELQHLAQLHPNLHYIPCISGADTPDGIVKGRVNEVVIRHNPELKGWRIYICGIPEMVYASQRAVFMAGAAIQDIHSDPFVYH